MRLSIGGRFAATAAALTLCACGGGGGGGGGGPVGHTNADFADTYFSVRASIDAGPPAIASASTGTISADGAGEASQSGMSNTMGVVTGPFTVPHQYAVAADGGVQFLSAGSVFAQGGLGAGGDCALVGLVVPAAPPAIHVMLRRRGFYDATSLSGAYHLAVFAASSSSGDSTSYTGPVTFDGAGNASGTLTSNAMGTIAVLPVAFTHTLAGDGASTTTIGGASYPGGIAAGGEIALWGGSTTPTEDVALIVAVRGATSAGPATLAGEYWIVCLTRNAVVVGSASVTGTLACDGAGGAVLSGTSNVNGTVATATPATATYTVAADGTFVLTLGGLTLQGGVTQDGRFAVLGGATNPASSPTICVLCRK